MKRATLVFRFDDESAIITPFPQFMCADINNQPLEPLQDGFSYAPRYRGVRRRDHNMLVEPVVKREIVRQTIKIIPQRAIPHRTNHAFIGRYWAEMPVPPRQPTVFCKHKRIIAPINLVLVAINEHASKDEFGIAASAP